MIDKMLITLGLMYLCTTVIVTGTYLYNVLIFQGITRRERAKELLFGLPQMIFGWPLIFMVIVQEEV